MPRLYATLAQVRNYTGNQGLVLSPRDLANASRFVEAATLGALYLTDDAGMPTDTTQAAAFTEAVCELLALAQPAKPAGAMSDDIAAMRRNGVKAATVNGVRIELRDDVELADDGTQVPASVRLILDQAGLAAGPVIVLG